jgi:sugar/nucleoside kinase (ribokinase family)
MRVCSLGDLVLDVIVRLQRPLARGADAPSRITTGPGGQAANVAAWVSALGGEGRWLGKRGADPAGRLAGDGLAALGVDLRGPVAPEGSGVLVSLVEPGGERSMCPDRGVATTLSPDDVLAEHLAGCDWLQLSGYALFVEPVASAAARAVTVAREAGARVGVDLASWSDIRVFGPPRFREVVRRLEPDVVFANEEEDAEIGGRFSGPAWILKRGAAGCSFDGDVRPALAVKAVVDTTGAGDALAAGWLVGGPDLALAAAARCVQTAGSMPDV